MGSISTFDKHGVNDSENAVSYQISPVTLASPSNRPLKVIVIGAGVSGILIAYKIQRYLENVELKIYESNAQIGGTWLLNRYPGCACDIPSHAYQFPFAPNPEWPSFFSSAQDIWDYLKRVVDTFDLQQYMQFSTRAVQCVWQEEVSKWRVLLRRRDEVSGTSLDFEDECDVLLQATGVLNNFKWPTIPGIDKFQGKLIHTARWPDSYQKDQWKENVVIIGSGASSIQTVPTMQPHATRLHIFMRTPVWFVDIAGNEGRNSQYSEEQRADFRKSPEILVGHAKFLEDQINGGWSMMLKDSPEQREAQESVGCRRITPGDPYLNAIQQANVKLHFEEAIEITETSVIGKEGTEVKTDTIVCATGFDTSFRPAFEIIGKNGTDLREKWQQCPEAYLGLAIPDFPNFFIFIGPSWPIGNGSVMGPLNSVGDYVVQFLQKMQREIIQTFEVRKEITDLFNVHVQEYMKNTVWTDTCRSWYKDPKTNRVNAVWPGSSLHYIEAVATPRFEDYTFRYFQHNPWAFLGMGHTRASQSKSADKSTYLAVDKIDPLWSQIITQPARVIGVNTSVTSAQQHSEAASDTPIYAKGMHIEVSKLTV